MKKYIYTLALVLSLIILPQISFADTTLGVTQITAVKNSATANNSYTDGWKWIFNITVPSGEDKLQIKFTDWTNGSASIPVAGNMHFYSTQSLNATSSASAVSINSASTYGDELILDPSKGQQIQVAVEVKIPTGTTGGAYSTNYGIQTTGTTTPDAPALSLRLSSSSQATSTIILSNNPEISSGPVINIFEIKPKDNSVIWINDLTFKLNNNSGYDSKLLLTGAWISVPGQPVVFNMGEWSDNNTVIFHNLNTRLSKDWGDFSLQIESISTTTGFTISTTLDASEIKAEDNSGNSLDISNISDITSNEISFLASSTATSTATSTIPQASILTTPIDYIYNYNASYGYKNLSFGTYNLTSTNQSSTLKSLKFKINNDIGVNSNTLFNNTILNIGGYNYNSSSFSSDGIANFSNLNILMDKDVLIPINFTADNIGGSSTKFITSATLLANTIIAVDNNGNTSATTSATDITAGRITFSPCLLDFSARGTRTDVKDDNNNLTGYIFNYILDIGSQGANGFYVSKTTSLGNMTSVYLNEASQEINEKDTDNAYYLGDGMTHREFKVEKSSDLTGSFDTEINVSCGLTSEDSSAWHFDYLTNYGQKG